MQGHHVNFQGASLGTQAVAEGPPRSPTDVEQGGGGAGHTGQRTSASRPFEWATASDTADKGGGRPWEWPPGWPGRGSAP